MKTLGNEIFGELPKVQWGNRRISQWGDKNKPDSLMPVPSACAAELAVVLTDLLFN